MNVRAWILLGTIAACRRLATQRRHSDPIGAARLFAEAWRCADLLDETLRTMKGKT